ncbi:hypothetical protein C8F04DRAFT_1120562 [Mycena alexandri]|uniref:Uncharacterized protein n=1 Tax=Mycena alexandri TaxID=1745969 RepID=A0AAD6SM21_9AGAR|nr:hypothetical protein C8F04DRAFT_1120562 [Mycena alexandri]
MFPFFLSFLFHLVFVAYSVSYIYLSRFRWLHTSIYSLSHSLHPSLSALTYIHPSRLSFTYNPTIPALHSFCPIVFFFLLSYFRPLQSLSSRTMPWFVAWTLLV